MLAQSERKTKNEKIENFKARGSGPHTQDFQMEIDFDLEQSLSESFDVRVRVQYR
jgi:hypothetical protein